MAIVGHTKYEFPWRLFSGDRRSSLTSLCLNSCKFSVPRDFRGFSSLTKLFLVMMRMTLKETANSPHELPKPTEFTPDGHLKELILSLSPACGTFKIDTPALQRLEYCGELLPASTFQSLL
ncbi:hypothetical protein EJB05_15259, partial [Eragrostis curvula]